MKNGLLWILNDLDCAGRGKKRDGEEGGTRRVKKLKIEKIAKGRIICLAGPCYYASHYVTTSPGNLVISRHWRPNIANSD